MSSSFATAAYRFGHSMISPTLLRLDENGEEIPEGNLSLRDAFFQPHNVTESGIDPILLGASSQTAQAVDTLVIDDLQLLFGPPGSGGLDLVSLNIQRGRDHELPGYNDAREQLGLPRIESFDDPIWKDGIGEKLAGLRSSG
ncbi:MAG: peroxidase family protein [Thiolinea sp.]